MNWEHKLLAIQALHDGVSFRMIAPGKWSVLFMGVARTRPGAPTIEFAQPFQGASPEEAIEKLWAWLTEADYDIVRDPLSLAQAYFQWNRVLWIDRNSAYERNKAI